MEMKKYAAIDVGIKGGIAVLSDDNLELYPIPKIKQKVDYRALVSLLEGVLKDCFVVIEDVHSIFGSSAKSNFNFGFIKGFKVASIVAAGCPYELVPPKTWQKEIWTNADMVKKANNRTDTKATSLMAAKRLFPAETFLATERSKKPSDGLVDAALMAEYCRRKFG